MSHANANKIQAAMIALDLEKAFDRVDWHFPFKALQHFGYGPEITENKNSLSKYRNKDQGKRTLVASFSSEKRTAARMPVIYDSGHYICGNIFREYKTKQWYKRYCNRRKEAENFCYCR